MRYTYKLTEILSSTVIGVLSSITVTSILQPDLPFPNVIAGGVLIGINLWGISHASKS